jgi:hypothetical protein
MRQAVLGAKNQNKAQG